MQANYMASAKISILTGLTLLNRSKIIEGMFETVGKYNVYVNTFFNITKVAFELVDEKNVIPLGNGLLPTSRRFCLRVWGRSYKSQ